MNTYRYLLTVAHDAGNLRVVTVATSAHRAIAIVMVAEGCPRSSIVSCRRLGRLL